MPYPKKIKFTVVIELADSYPEGFELQDVTEETVNIFLKRSLQIGLDHAEPPMTNDRLLETSV